MLAMLMDAHDSGQLKFFNTHAGLAEKRTFKHFIATLRRIHWVVHCKAPFAGPEQVLRYLSRYTVGRRPTPASRRDQRRPNRQGQRGGHGNTRPMPVAVQQRLLARVQDQDESLGILIGVFAINPVLQRSCAWPLYSGLW